MENKKMLYRSKWEKWNFLNSNEELGKCQPLTKIYSQKNLSEFLSQFGSAFIKPSGSLGGNNVIKVFVNGYKITAIHESQEYPFDNTQEFDKWLKNIKRNKLFLIQQSIDLTTFEGNPADIRIVVQLNEHQTWEVTGWYAKVAKSGSIVTNAHSGGTLITLEKYLKHAGFSESEVTKLIQKMFDLSIKICEAYGTTYRNTKYGLDVGFDKDGKIWLIEINTLPWMSLLKRIDKQMYLRTVYLSRMNRNSKK